MPIHAFRMQLKPGMLARYRAAHDAIWPDLTALLRSAGISDYSIFHDAQSDALFAILTRPDDDGGVDLAAHPIMRRWWHAMAPLMETHPDDSPCQWPLERVFHLP